MPFPDKENFIDQLEFMEAFDTDEVVEWVLMNKMDEFIEDQEEEWARFERHKCKEPELL